MSVKTGSCDDIDRFFIVPDVLFVKIFSNLQTFEARRDVLILQHRVHEVLETFIHRVIFAFQVDSLHVVDDEFVNCFADFFVFHSKEFEEQLEKDFVFDHLLAAKKHQRFDDVLAQARSERVARSLDQLRQLGAVIFHRFFVAMSGRGQKDHRFRERLKEELAFALLVSLRFAEAILSGIQFDNKLVTSMCQKT
jgi:hypothetical protein